MTVSVSPDLSDVLSTQRCGIFNFPDARFVGVLGVGALFFIGIARARIIGVICSCG
jgi:hypothetical protein